MDYGMIGKIEKAKLYAQELDRVTFNTLTVEFHGDNSDYTVTLSPEGWDCNCPGHKQHGVCPHVMALEKLLKPMLKRQPSPYLRTDKPYNHVSDVEKANRYAQETDRMRLVEMNAGFRGDNGDHNVNLGDGQWDCTCSFFKSRNVCCHTMALERMLKDIVLVIPAYESV